MPATFKYFRLIGALLLGGGSVASAGIIQVDLQDASLSGSPGTNLAFFATLTNLSATDTIYFNGAGATAAGSSLTIDLDPFFANGPISLDAGQTSSLFEIFDVAIGAGAALGPYIGNTVSLQGGADGGAGTAFDDLVDISFDVEVQPVTVAAPEPGAFSMFALATLLASLARVSQRRRTLSVGMVGPGGFEPANNGLCVRPSDVGRVG
jgi:hypothetical protein